MKNPREIGVTIRTTRKRLGLRQAETAAAAGVGVRFLSELESGKPTAELGKTLAVLHALGIRIELHPPDTEAHE